MQIRFFLGLSLRWTLLFIFLTQIALAQTPLINQDKYWEYRERLKTDYLWIGEGKGKSIPASYIWNPYNTLHWGDATLGQGWYLGILATEYQLSSKNVYLETGEEGEIDAKSTLLELYYALKAVERLDFNAEVFYGAHTDLNGFLICDDVDDSILMHFDKRDGIGSDYTAENTLDNEMSQDQCYHLLMGLVLVKHFIPAATQVKGEYLTRLAEKLGLLIIEQVSKNNWRISNPARLDQKGNPECVSRGNKTHAFGKGLVDIKKKLLDSENVDDPKVGFLHKIFWGSLRAGINPAYASSDNSHMIQVISATGNGFKNKTYTKLIKRSKKNIWLIYPLLNKVLFPTNKDCRTDILSGTELLLNSAPNNGPFSSFPETNIHGWGSHNRFLNSPDVQQQGRKYTQGRLYSGLDFMLLYNLCRIIKTESYKDAWKLLEKNNKGNRKSD